MPHNYLAITTVQSDTVNKGTHETEGEPMTYFYKLQDRTDLDNPSTLEPPIIGKCLIEQLRTQHEITPHETLQEHYQAAEGDYRFITETPSGMKTRYSLYSKDGDWHAIRCDSSIPR